MISEAEFLARWRRERPMFDAFGELVKATLCEAVATLIGRDPKLGFFKLPISHRLKEEESMLAKAYQRKKYADPYGQVEDKVGVRAVVLFVDDISIVEHAIKETAHWHANKARDFQEEKRDRPFEFDYQSVHYMLSASANCSHGKTLIDEGTPCELQIRTLLQHAYSELTHDTIYKPSLRVEPEVKRAAAKSMALIEATDDYFMQVRSLLNAAMAPTRAFGSMLSDIYQQRTRNAGEAGILNDLLLDHYRASVETVTRGEIEAFLDAKPYIASRISSRAGYMSLFRAPAILLIYYLVAQNPYAVGFEDRPMTDDELSAIYSDLGLSMPSNNG